MRDEDDSDNRMIFIWSLLEVFVMIIVAVIQVLSIRKYLKQKQVILVCKLRCLLKSRLF